MEPNNSSTDDDISTSPVSQSSPQTSIPTPPQTTTPPLAVPQNSQTPPPSAPTPPANVPQPMVPNPALAPSVTPEDAKGKSVKKKVIIIIVIIILFMGGGLIALGLVAQQPKKYSKDDLITYQGDGYSFKYPKKWEKDGGESTPTNAVTFIDYENDKKTVTNAVIRYGMLRQPEPSQVGKKLTKEEYKKYIEQTLKESQQNQDSAVKSYENSLGCTEGKFGAMTPYEDNFLHGIAFSFHCVNKAGRITLKMHMGLNPSNQLVGIAITAPEKTWENNNELFDAMLDSLKD